MMNVQNWKLFIDLGITPIAQVLTLVPGIDQTKVVMGALDGSTYIQTIGEGREYANIEILANASEMRAVNLAEANGSLLVARYRDRFYHGYIESPPDWGIVAPGEWFTTTIKLLYEKDV